LKLQNQAVTAGFDRVMLREGQISELIRNIFAKMRDVYDMQSPLLSKEHQSYFYDALVILNLKSTFPIVAEVKNLHAVVVTKNADGDDRDQKSVSKRFEEFKRSILEDEEIIALTANCDDALLSKLEKIPFIKDSSDSEIRLDSLLGKLVSHIRGSILFDVVDNRIQATMNVRCTTTSIWIIKMFRSLIERKWGMTIHERDDDGGAEQDIAFHEIMTLLNECGATPLCFDLIITGIDKELQLEAINLLVAMVSIL
jgi:hypothetical protein